MTLRFALLLLLAAGTAAQAEIYQWKDEQGRTHFGEDVPARYRQAAKQVDSGRLNTMPAQKPAAPRPAVAAEPAQSAEAAPPRVPLSEEERCEAALLHFQESQACFARFRLANGALRPEAYDECPVVAMPSGCSTNR